MRWSALAVSLLLLSPQTTLAQAVVTNVGIDATYKRERREYGERVAYAPIDLSDYL